MRSRNNQAGLPNQFDTGPDWDWVSSVGGQYAQSNNPGSRRARLAGAVYSDDRHLDPGTGDFVTMVLRRFTCHAPPCVWALCGVGTETFCLRYLTDSMSALGHERTLAFVRVMSAYAAAIWLRDRLSLFASVSVRIDFCKFCSE